MPDAIPALRPYAEAFYGRTGQMQPKASSTGSQVETEARAVQDQVDLSPEARRELERLKATDERVRAHEAAHMAAGAGIVQGGASFSTRRGPDGKDYAVGGEVSIDASPVSGDPRATLAKAQIIQAAALAPADPSPQDRAVAASAAQMASKASAELSGRVLDVTG